MTARRDSLRVPLAGSEPRVGHAALPQGLHRTIECYVSPLADSGSGDWELTLGAMIQRDFEYGIDVRS